MSEADFSSDSTWCFSVSAAREAGVMLRVLELFAKRGLVPDSVHAGAGDDGPAGLVLDLQVSGLSADTAAHIAACLRSLVDVGRVLLAEKGRRALSAGAAG